MKDVGKIKDACLVIAGQSPQGSSYNEDGIGVEFHQGKKAFGDSIIEPSGVWTTEPSKIAEAGDILMSVRAPVGPTNVTDRKICIGRGLAAIRCKDGFLPQYILYSLRNIESKIIGNDGAIFNSINKTQIEDLPLPLLSPDDQQSIVEYLDSSFAKIDAMKANAKKALDEAKALFKISQIFLLEPQEDWKRNFLTQLGDLKNGMNFNKNESGNSVHILGVGDFGNNFQIDNTDDLPLISLNSMPSSDYILQEDDIVFVRSNGNKNLVGRCVLVHVGDEPSSFSGFCIRFRKNSNDIDANYLTHFLKSEASRKKLVGNGANISNLSQKVLNNFVVYYPSLQEQNVIVSTLDALKIKVDQLQANYDKITSECDILKQVILRQVFE